MKYIVLYWVPEGLEEPGTNYGWRVFDWCTNKKTARQSFLKAAKDHDHVVMQAVVTLMDSKGNPLEDDE